MQGEDLSRYVSVVELRVDSHYTDGVVSLGTIVEMFGIAGTKLAYMIDGDGGLMRAFESVEFLAPVYHGDFVRATARAAGCGQDVAKTKLRAARHRAHPRGRTAAHSGEVLDPPILAARARGDHRDAARPAAVDAAGVAPRVLIARPTLASFAWSRHRCAA
jgi:3-aminobutyryl-CoA ammonia-lyase